MSNFQWVDIKLPTQISRIITDTHPAQIQIGGMSGTDSCSLIISLKVGGYVGVGPAVMSVEQTWDDGVTWVPLSNTVNVTGVGTFIWRHNNASNGGLSPQVRVVITPPAGESLVIDKLKRTFSPSNTIVPPATPAGAGGLATEGTLSAIEALLVAKFDTATSALDTSIQATTTAINTQVDTKTSALDTSIQATTTAINTQVDTKTSALNTSIQAITTAIGNWDKGSGVTSANTLRNVPASDAPHLLAPRHEAVGTPLSVRLSDAVDFLSSLAVTAAQTTFSAVTKALHIIATVTGWDGATHRELLLDTSGAIRIASTDLTTLASPIERTQVVAPYLRDYSVANITNSSWTQIIAATAVRGRKVKIFDSSGQPVVYSLDAGVTEAFIAAPGGEEFEYVVPAGATVHIKSKVAATISTGILIVNLLT